MGSISRCATNCFCRESQKITILPDRKNQENGNRKNAKWLVLQISSSLLVIQIIAPDNVNKFDQKLLILVTFMRIHEDFKNFQYTELSVYA